MKLDGEMWSKYSVFDLFIIGSRMTDDFDEQEAVDMYVELHPAAKEEDVRAELARLRAAARAPTQRVDPESDGSGQVSLGKQQSSTQKT